MARYSFLPLSQTHVDEFSNLCPLNHYCTIKLAQVTQGILSLVPSGLWKKSDSLFLLSSGSAVATSYCMINCNRWDFKANAIDQEPIFFAHVGGEPRLNAIAYHHGNWTGRTTPVPPDFYDYLNKTGLGNFYPISSIPEIPSGSIGTLTQTGQHEAFAAGVKRIIQLSQKKNK